MANRLDHHGARELAWHTAGTEGTAIRRVDHTVAAGPFAAGCGNQWLR